MNRGDRNFDSDRRGTPHTTYRYWQGDGDRDRWWDDGDRNRGWDGRRGDHRDRNHDRYYSRNRFWLGLGAPYGYLFGYRNFPYYYYGGRYGYPYSNYYYNGGYPSYGYTYPGGTYSYSDSYTPAPAEPHGDFLAQAKNAFRRGNYESAARLATHAAIDSPKDPAVHQFMSLTLFALGEYSPAAGEAHAALDLGAAPDWRTTSAQYGNANEYTTQLRALESHVKQNPQQPETRFLLGYQYLMLGHRDAAKAQFVAAAERAPQDELARQLVERLGGASIATTPPEPSATR